MIIPKFIVREARIEDNDDIIPILKYRNIFEQSHIDDYFFANLLQDDANGNSKFFVGMVDDKIVGFLAVSEKINISLIQHVYDIDSFPDLIKFSSLEKFQYELVPVVLLTNVSKDLNTIIHDLAKHQNYFVKNLELNCADKDSSDVENFPYDINAIRLELNQIISTGYRAIIVIVNDLSDDELFKLLTSDARIGCAICINYKLNSAVLEGSKIRNIFVDVSESDLEKEFRLVHEVNSIIYDFRNKFQLKYNDKMNNGNGIVKANAFGVTIFCMYPEYESSGNILLQMAFEEFTKLDYCLFLIPCSQSVSNYLEFMTPITVKPGVSFNQTLLVSHRDSIVALHSLHVAKVDKHDLSQLTQFLSNSSVSPNNFNYVDSILRFSNACLNSDVEFNDNPNELSFLFKVNNEIIGICNVSKKATNIEDIVALRTYFDLDKDIDFSRHRGKNHAKIIHWSLSSLFSPWSKAIIREILRMYGKTVLYLENNRAFEFLSQDLFVNLRPSVPRQQIQSQLEDITFRNPLYFITKYHLSNPRILNTMRIIVVDGGVYSKSFLQSIMFSKVFHFVNVTVIMDNIPGEAQQKSVKSDSPKYLDDYSGCLSISDVSDFTDYELKALGMMDKCSLISGRVTDIDRINKSVVLSDEVVLEYDILVLSPSVKDSTFKSFPTTARLHPTICEEKAIFGLGDKSSDANAMSWIMKYLNSKPRIVVYGKGLELYNVIGRLMKFGVNASYITAVTPDTLFPDFGHVTVSI